MGKLIIKHFENARGEPIAGDQAGNNAAFTCQVCSYPILASAKPKPKGGFERPNKAICKACKSTYALEWILEPPETLVIKYESETGQETQPGKCNRE